MARTILITGCSSGIGRALAQTLHQRGDQVIATARDINKLSELATAGITTLPLDVTAQRSIDALFSTLAEQAISVDVLVNNAGYGAMGPAAEMPANELEKQFATNVFGPMALIRAVAPLMKQQGGGLIVNVGSVSGILVTPFSGAYCATKAALHALSDALRMELAPFNIRVMTVMPGAIESEFGNNAAASLARTLPADSLYHWTQDGIDKRARASQSNPTPTQSFVDALVRAMDQQQPAAEVRIGNGSTALPLMARVLPTALRDWVLKRSFGLNRQAPS